MLREPGAYLLTTASFGIACPGKTHRELFSEFYEDLLRAPLAPALAANPAPPASLALFRRMMHDILSGGQTSDVMEQVPSRFLPGVCPTQHAVAARSYA